MAQAFHPRTPEADEQCGDCLLEAMADRHTKNWGLFTTFLVHT